MKILHLAPLWFPVSRDAPGGVETYLPGLIAALERRGCRNTLIASGDSHTDAALVPVMQRNLNAQMEDGTALEYVYYEQHQLLLALERCADVDVVHSHLGWAGYVLSGVPGLKGRVLHTQHNPVYPDQEWFIRQHPDLWLSTVSEFQARKLRERGATRCTVIPNAIDVSSFTFRPRAGSNLFFIGRMEEAKGPDLAVQVARTLDLSLTLAGPMTDEDFFNATVKPFLNNRIRYVGVVNHPQKNELYGQAGCVLMPSRVEEGFGMVSIEAMACGTPVVALPSGALPEIIEPGVNGYLIEDETAAPTLAQRAFTLDRAAIRARVAERFDIPPIAEQYLQLYRQITDAPR